MQRGKKRTAGKIKQINTYRVSARLIGRKIGEHFAQHKLVD